MKNDDELKQLLAKMLPEVLLIHTDYDQSKNLRWKEREVKLDSGRRFIQQDRAVLPTELLHLCSLAEATLGDIDQWLLYDKHLAESGTKFNFSATWKQRAEALAKILEVKP